MVIEVDALVEKPNEPPLSSLQNPLTKYPSSILAGDREKEAELQVGVIGLSHHSSSLETREQIAGIFTPSAQATLQQQGIPHVVLATCNRFEIYFSGEDLFQVGSLVLEILQRGGREEGNLREHLVESKFYVFLGARCFCHLAEVTAGLDSQVIGETEIQRQVKEAYKASFEKGGLSQELHFVFQKCLGIGKKLRTLFSLGRDHFQSSPYLPLNLEGAIFQLSLEVFPGKYPSVFFLGNSLINRKVFVFFQKKGVKEVALCTRTKEAAQKWQRVHPGKILSWEERVLWHKYDLIICGSKISSQAFGEYLLTLEEEPQEKKLICDLGVPRNVDPQIGKHPFITLWNIEQLGGLLEMHRQEAFQGLSLWREKIREEVAQCIKSYRRRA